AGDEGVTVDAVALVRAVEDDDLLAPALDGEAEVVQLPQRVAVPDRRGAHVVGRRGGAELQPVQAEGALQRGSVPGDVAVGVAPGDAAAVGRPAYAPDVAAHALQLLHDGAVRGP